MKDLLGKTDIDDKFTGFINEKKQAAKEAFDSMFGPIDIKGVGLPIDPETQRQLDALPNDEEPEVKPEVLSAIQPEDNEWSRVGRPPKNPYSDILKEVFGESADEMERVLRWGTPDDQGYGVNYGGENLSYDATHVNTNKDGSRDIGLFQINENTYNDFNRRNPQAIIAAGIKSYDDLFDPKLNARMAKIILDEQGFGAWYGAPNDII